MTNAPLHFRPQLPSPVHMARGTLASPVSPVLGRERPSVPVRVSTFTPVTGVPVRSDRPSSPPAPTSSPAFAESASASHSGIVALTPGASSFSLAKVWSAVRESYGASKPTFREGVIFLSTVAVLFAFATILLDLGR